MYEATRHRIGEIIGEASMCWSETPSGVFNSDKASELLDEIMTHIQYPLKHPDDSEHTMSQPKSNEKLIEELYNKNPYRYRKMPNGDDGLDNVRAILAQKDKEVAEAEQRVLSWVKTNKDGSIYMGMGRHTRANAEICLLATKGKGVPRINASVYNTQLHPRSRHSEKPQAFRDEIVRLYGNVPRIELFARQKTEGWDVWGNEVTPDISI